MDPENPIVQLCIAGMAAEAEGRAADAKALFEQAWETSQDDFEACVAAHYVARHQATPAATLDWNERALRRAEAAAIRERYTAGIGWGEMKQVLFERINAELAPARAEYERLMAAPGEVERLLKAGAEKARAVSKPFLAEIRDRVGIRPLAR